MSMNRVLEMGRLVRDPELRRTGSGIPVATFSIAVDRDHSSKEDGSKETDFFDVVAWRSTAEFVAKYLTKGRMIAVDGKLQSRSYEDKDGNKRKAVEIVAERIYFADSGRDSARPTSNPDTYENQQAGLSEFAYADDDGSDLPF